jgi:TetR/AcrR family transcriptional regulator, mexJK operon transcriptional repressor
MWRPAPASKLIAHPERIAVTDRAAAKPISESRSARKRRAILDAATDVFLAEGFAGASMDAIATAAGVSKPTVYNHFADKKQLFEQIVNDLVAAITQPFYEQIVNLADDEDLAKPLRELAGLLLTGVMQPTNLRLRRLVIGEASRFPDLGRAYERQGPERALAAWTTAFKRLADEGRLRLQDPALAAKHFQSLVLTTPLNHAMLSGDDRPPRAAQRKRYADSAVDVFLAAYGTA